MLQKYLAMFCYSFYFKRNSAYSIHRLILKNFGVTISYVKKNVQNSLKQFPQIWQNVTLVKYSHVKWSENIGINFLG